MPDLHAVGALREIDVQPLAGHAIADLRLQRGRTVLGGRHMISSCDHARSAFCDYCVTNTRLITYRGKGPITVEYFFPLFLFWRQPKFWNFLLF